MTGKHRNSSEQRGPHTDMETGVHADELTFDHIETATLLLRRATKDDKDVEAALNRFYDVLEEDYGLDFAPKYKTEHLSPKAQTAWSEVEDAVKAANIKRKTANNE